MHAKWTAQIRMTQNWLFKTATEIIQSHYCITFTKENLLLHLRSNYWETAWKMASHHLITNMWWQHQTPQSGLNVPLKQLAGSFCSFCPGYLSHSWTVCPYPQRNGVALLKKGGVLIKKDARCVCEVVAAGLRPVAVPGNGTGRVWERSAPKGGALAEHLLPR